MPNNDTQKQLELTDLIHHLETVFKQAEMDFKAKQQAIQYIIDQEIKELEVRDDLVITNKLAICSFKVGLNVALQTFGDFTASISIKESSDGCA